MTYRYGNICTVGDASNNNFVTAWTMVFGNDGLGWAQSGIFYAYGYGCWHHFAQQERNYFQEAPFTIIGSCVGQGEVHKVWQQTVNVGNPDWRIRSNIDSTIFIQSTWNQFTQWSQPFQVAFDGEARHNASDIPGYGSVRTDYSGMQVQDYFNDNFFNTCGYINLGVVSSPRYAVSGLNCDHIQVWTSG